MKMPCSHLTQTVSTHKVPRLDIRLPSAFLELGFVLLGGTPMVCDRAVKYVTGCHDAKEIDFVGRGMRLHGSPDDWPMDLQ